VITVSKTKPGFVIQIANNPGGVSACSNHGQLA